MHQKKPEYLFNLFNICFPVRTSFSFLVSENVYIQEIVVDYQYTDSEMCIRNLLGLIITKTSYE